MEILLLKVTLHVEKVKALAPDADSQGLVKEVRGG
jgi:hypothetical protein